MDALGLDKVLIVPSCIPPHKLPAKLASGKDRLEMCRLAFTDEHFEVSPIELNRGSRSYTVETLRELKKIYPQDELYFIIGSDMLETLTGWYLWEEILSLAHICAASREKGFSADLSCFSAEQKKRIIVLDLAPYEVSSTEIRGITARGEVSLSLVEPEVAEYIKRKGLYDDGLSQYRKLISERLDAYRLNHSECVSECAALLAERYGADVEKARLAGLLHDVTKNTPAAEQLKIIEKACISLLPTETANSKVWHQISGAEFLKSNGIISDKEILGAVRWHTTGRAGMTLLEKIVYVADFISADREYADVDVVRRLAEISLEHAILYTSRYTIKKLVSEDLPIHSATVDCYNDMLLHFNIRKG